MQQIDELIENLSSSNVSLIDALIKTKVLLYRLGRKDLADWINKEIVGYKDEDSLPHYRVVSSAARGSVTNGVYTYNNIALPVLRLSERDRNNVETLKLVQSIAALEGLIDQDKKGLAFALSPDYASYIFRDTFEGGYSVQQAWKATGVGQIAEVLTQVRSSLLDFLCELNQKIEPDMSEDELKKIAESPETSSMFNHAIFGDNVTIVVGNNNSQNISNTVNKGDFESLANQLRLNKVEEEDIKSLEVALQTDEQASELVQKKFGPKVKNWMSSMLKKAIDATWQVELGVAGGLLTTALQRYYGW